MATAAVLAFGSASAAAFAQEDPTSTPPAPTETTTPAESTPQPAPQPSPQPLETAAQAAQQTGLSGVLYADKNRNGQQDAGEALSGQEIYIVGGEDGASHRADTDADGNFVFAGLAPGVYRSSMYLADGWVVRHVKPGGELFTVTANTMTKVVVRAERPYSEQLTVTASLDRESYRLPASAKITLKLANITNRKINNIKVLCNRLGAPHALGNGRGWDALVANGVTLDAGESIPIKIVEEIPEAASKDGLVTLDCLFAPHVGWNNDGARVHAEAKVSGGVGAYTMQLGQDRNANSRVDADEVVKDAQVLLVRPQTGEQVAQATSGADGKIEFGGLPVGEYRAVVVGSWMFTDPGQQLLRITGQGGFSYGFLKYAAPADLRATVKADKPRYEAHETVRLEVTVKNIGGQTAERSRLDWGPSALDIPDEAWGEFRPRGPGIRIPAGESRTFTVSGTIRDFRNGELSLWGWVDYLGRPNPHWSSFTGKAEVVETKGDVTGVVYTDKNRNGLPDPGEAAAGAEVRISGGAPYASRTTSTDSSGSFTFNALPSGDYWVEYALSDGWMVHIEGDARPQFRVKPGPPTRLTARADRPYRELLKATLTLDKSTYVVGEDAKITVRLTNTSDRQIVGIKAACNRVGDPHHFGGYDGPMPEGWGDLRYDSSGVTLAAGETKTIVVTEKVPAGARWRQQVVASCDFEPTPDYNTDGPNAFTSAAVPGGFGTVTGLLAHDRNANGVVDPGETIPNTRMLLLIDRESGLRVAEAVSDAQGNVRFDQLPPGEFWAHVDGPWKFEGDNLGMVDVRIDTITRVPFFVVPDPVATPRPGGDQPGGGTRGALAKTGASVLGLGVVAALLVAFGIGARVAGRRKTS